MVDEHDAAAGLITLARATTEDIQETRVMTPPRQAVQQIEYESPDHTRHLSIPCKGTKRPRDDLVLVLYDTGDREMAVPFIRGEDPQLFFDRRNKMTKATLEADIRNDVYCTWRDEIAYGHTQDTCGPIRGEFVPQRVSASKNCMQLACTVTCVHRRLKLGTAHTADRSRLSTLSQRSLCQTGPR